QTGDLGPRGELRGDPGQFEPRGEETGNLGALAGSNDDKHDIHLALCQENSWIGRHTKFTRKHLWILHKRISGVCRGHEVAERSCTSTVQPDPSHAGTQGRDALSRGWGCEPGRVNTE